MYKQKLFLKVTESSFLKTLILTLERSKFTLRLEGDTTNQAHHAAHGLHLISYMPLGRFKVDGFDGLMLSQKLDVTRIARKHASSPEQVLIAFHINRNIAALVKRPGVKKFQVRAFPIFFFDSIKSRDEQRIRENLNAAKLRHRVQKISKYAHF